MTLLTFLLILLLTTVVGNIVIKIINRVVHNDIEKRNIILCFGLALVMIVLLETILFFSL